MLIKIILISFAFLRYQFYISIKIAIVKRQKTKKNFMLNEAAFQINDFKFNIKNTIFNQSVFTMNPCDVVQDFLDNYDWFIFCL